MDHIGDYLHHVLRAAGQGGAVASFSLTIANLAEAAMSLKDILQKSSPQQAVEAWLSQFEAAARSGDMDALMTCFVEDCHWRDLLAFTWDLRTFSGSDSIRLALEKTLATAQPKAFEIAEGRTPPRVVIRAGEETLEAIITFISAVGTCSGVVRLVPDPHKPSKLGAWVFLTTLDEIRGHEEQIFSRRPRGDEFSGGFGEENWQDVRNREVAFEDREPAVLVVGGGQAGLGIAACLGVLGIDTLTIDRHERVGDAWRKRYHNLVLHNEVYVNDLPYMPYPPNWPVYIPKDKLANWFEAYSEAMELNFWTSTEIVSGSYDERAGQWTVELKREGKKRIVKPRHIVMATGVSAIPIRPDWPGLDTFEGKLMHSGEYQNGHEWKGKKAIVIGTGNSGHDVAHDLCQSGADTTLVQRGTTLIVSLAEAQRVYTMYHEGPPVADNDLLATAAPYPVLVKAYQMACETNQENDKDLLEGLKARGFKLDFGPPDNTGYQMKYLRRGGGYYFNVGCSELIIDGKIELGHFEDIEHFTPTGAKLKNGEEIQAELIVTATGYKNQQDVARLYLGDDVADRLGTVWGFGEDGEQRNMWRRTPQPGLWFTGGGLPHVRIFSKYLAMQIKACEEGLIELDMPEQFDGAEAVVPDPTDGRLVSA